MSTISLGGVVSQKGKAQYSWPPCTNQLRSTPLYIENIICLSLTKQATLMRRSTVLSLPIDVSSKQCLAKFLSANWFLTKRLGTFKVWQLVKCTFFGMLSLASISLTKHFQNSCLITFIKQISAKSSSWIIYICINTICKKSALLQPPKLPSTACNCMQLPATAT